MSDYNNRNNGIRRPDVENFKVNIDDNNFSMPDDTMRSLNGEHRINIDASNINEDRDKNLYYNDKKEKTNKKEHKKRDKIKSHKNKRIFRVVWITMVVLVALTLASYLIGGSNDFLAVDRKEGVTTVTIPKNVTVDELSEILAKSGAINKPEFFKIYCSLTTDMEYFEPGTFELDTNKDYEDIINTLQRGNDAREIVSITFQEGMSVQQIAQKFEDNGIAKADDILAACKTNNYDNYDMIADIGNSTGKYYKLEGYLFPDTYDFYKDEDIESILGKMLNDFQVRITSDIVSNIKKSNYSMDQIITLASIIQKEAANVDDMYMVSAVLHNRLERGDEMNIYTLGCDSTIYYPYSSKEDAPDGFTSDYDTYDINGLPAGAICNPGIDAIKAAISPSSKGADYFYFCHDSKGNAYYATTEEEHNNNLVAAGLA